VRRFQPPGEVQATKTSAKMINTVPSFDGSGGFGEAEEVMLE
jgi:hypothetical protein